MVGRGDVGVKSGKGFYEHGKEETTMAYETILVSRDAGTGVATITLNRPDRLNTLTPQLVDELERVHLARHPPYQPPSEQFSQCRFGR